MSNSKPQRDLTPITEAERANALESLIVQRVFAIRESKFQKAVEEWNDNRPAKARHMPYEPFYQAHDEASEQHGNVYAHVEHNLIF